MRRVARRFGIALLVASAGTFAEAGPPKAVQTPEHPDPASVERYGPAYRYPQAGWIVVHIEGDPYERGYQHGRLLAPEIADYVKALAARRSPKAADAAWASSAVSRTAGTGGAGGAERAAIWLMRVNWPWQSER